MNNAVVVGGGVAGLLSALMLKERFSSVTLVEKDQVCGGLFHSITNADGVAFDFGTHLLSDTGVPELDALLYDWLDTQQGHTFHVVKNGNFFRGTMNRTSPFVDARCLDEAEFRVGFAELLATKLFKPEDCPNLESYLNLHLGPTFTRAICAPVMQKHLGATLADLHPATPFVHKRVVCATPEESRRLKQDPFFDSKIAFTDYEDSIPATCQRYPRTGGIGQWVHGFEKKVADTGATLLNDRTVATVQERGGNAIGVTLDDGRYLPCDVLVWTISPFFLLKAAKIDFTPAPVKVQPIGLYHLVFDRPFLDENYYITCYDENLRTFRVTLYPNLRGTVEPPYNCTVEVIAEAGTKFDGLHDIVVDELVVMGIVDKGAKLLSNDMRVVPSGFPATTHAFMKSAAEQSALAAGKLDNALLLGRAKCPPFFTTDVLVEAYREISALIGEHELNRSQAPYSVS